MWAGLIILLAVTFGMSVGLSRWVGPGGLVAARVAGVSHSLLLLSMLLTAADGDRFNPLIFGWAGLSATPLMPSLAAGWESAGGTGRTARPAHGSGRRSAWA